MMTMVFCLAMLEGIPLSAQTQRAFKSAWKNMEKFYKESLVEAGVVGSSMMFINDGKMIGASTYGLADLATKRPVDERTIYHWASNTKMFTGIAVMQLRDRGLLNP
jgi:CubicO group peptidase (beta-lactamase class C family)